MTVAKTENFGRGQIGKDSKERFKDSTGASKFGSSQRSVYMCIWLSLEHKNCHHPSSSTSGICNRQRCGKEPWKEETEFSLTRQAERESQCYPNTQNAFSQLELQRLLYM